MLRFTFLILFSWINGNVIAQEIPQNPNKTDPNGKKQGKWTIFYDQNWNETQEESQAEFYRIATYLHGIPMGKVVDYYKNGIPQMAADSVIGENPEKYEGIVTFYRVDGSKEKEVSWKNGQEVKETYYDLANEAMELNWQKLDSIAAKNYYQGNYEKALDLFTKAKIQAEKEFGKSHPKYAEACNNLGFIYQEIGAFEPAEANYQESIQVIKKIKGKKNSDYATSINNLATLYNDMGKFAEAEKLYLEALEIREEILGKSHSDYANSLNNLANFYMKQGKSELAEKWLLEAKMIVEQSNGKNNIEYTEACNSLGFLFLNLGNYQEAEPLFIEAKNIAEDLKGKENFEYVLYTNNLANLYYRQDNYQEAEQLFLEVKNIYEKSLGKEHPGYASILNNLGGLCESVQKYEKAEDFYRQSIAVREAVLGKGHPDYAMSLNNLAVLCGYLERFDEAEKLLIEAKNILEKIIGKEHPQFINIVSNLASLYRDQGKLSLAKPIYEESRKVLEKIYGKKHLDYALACQNLARLYYDMGLYQRAEPFHIEAKDIVRELIGTENQVYARYCNNLAILYDTQGRYAEAEALYLESKDITLRVLGNNHTEYASTCNNLAILYYNLGLYAKAEPLFLEAGNIRANTLGEAHSDYGTTCNNLGALYESQKFYAKAETWYLKAKHIWEKSLGKNHPKYTFACNNLAFLYETQGRYDEAENLLKEAKDIRAKVLGKNHPDYGEVSQNLAALYKTIGKYKEAEPLYLEARKIFENTYGTDHPYYAKSSNSLAKLYFAKKQYAKAEGFFREAIQNKLRQTELVLPTLNEAQRKEYLQSIRFFFEDFYNFCVQDYSKNPAIATDLFDLQLSIKGILFQSFQKMQNLILESNDSTLINQYNSWKEQRAYLAKIIQMSREDKITQGIHEDSIRNKTEELERTLSQASEIFAKNTRKVKYSWQDVRTRLNPGEALVEIIRIAANSPQNNTDNILYAALIITSNTQDHPKMLILQEGYNLETKYLNNYRNSIKYRKPDNESYLNYWAEINKLLQKESIKKVYFSPDGIYHQINILTLQKPETGQFLVDEMEIQLLGTPRDLIEFADNPQKQSQSFQESEVYLFGYPLYSKYPEENQINSKKEDRNVLLSTFQWGVTSDTLQRTFSKYGYIPLLPGTKEEVEQIEQICLKQKISTKLFTELYANEENLKSLDNPGILHIATHGFFLADLPHPQEGGRGFIDIQRENFTENPLLRCGLLLSGAEQSFKEHRNQGEDGILTAEEALNLNLENTNMVVLSACETGLGEISNGEGVYGLQRAFQQAGAKTVLMSLWAVSDEATQDLMTTFYENLLQKNQSKRKAFLHAQNALRVKYPEPFFWGAFVMVGE